MELFKHQGTYTYRAKSGRKLSPVFNSFWQLCVSTVCLCVKCASVCQPFVGLELMLSCHNVFLRTFVSNALLLITSNWNDIDIWIKKNIFKWNLLARWPNYQSKVYFAKVFNLLWESILTKTTIVDQSEHWTAICLYFDHWSMTWSGWVPIFWLVIGDTSAFVHICDLFVAGGYQALMQHITDMLLFQLFWLSHLDTRESDYNWFWKEHQNYLNIITKLEFFWKSGNIFNGKTGLYPVF